VQRRILALLERDTRRYLTTGRIATALAITRAQAYRAVKALSDRGLVEVTMEPDLRVWKAGSTAARRSYWRSIGAKFANVELKRPQWAKCIVDGCTRSAHCRGWCVSHYMTWLKTGDPGEVFITRTPEERFWDRVQMSPENNCWGWRGRPTIGVNGKTMLAHRYCWELHYGPIPARTVILRSCRNEGCVNPEHLYAQHSGFHRRPKPGGQAPRPGIGPG